MLKPKILCACLASVFLTACFDETVSSSQVATSDMYAELHVVRGNDGEVVAKAVLREGSAQSSTYVDLSSDDQLIATLGAAYVVPAISGNLFSELNALGDTYHLLQGGPDQDWLDIMLPFLTDYSENYTASMAYSDDAQPVFVGLVRTEFTDALQSYTTMPAAFNLVSPANGSLHAGNTDLTLNWAPADANYPITLSIRTECEDGGYSAHEFDIAPGQDAGHYTLAASDLRPADSVALCHAQLVLDRSRNGTLDAHFAGGGIQGHQVRQVSVIVTAP